jgi:hypothetical protein
VLVVFGDHVGGDVDGFDGRDIGSECLMTSLEPNLPCATLTRLRWMKEKWMAYSGYETSSAGIVEKFDLGCARTVFGWVVPVDADPGQMVT